MTNINAIFESHARAKVLSDEIAALKLKLDVEKAILVTAGSGKHSTPTGTFQVSANNQYDADVITSHLSRGQFMKVSKRMLDKGLCKILYPQIYALGKQEHGFKVSV